MHVIIPAAACVGSTAPAPVGWSIPNSLKKLARWQPLAQRALAAMMRAKREFLATWWLRHGSVSAHVSPRADSNMIDDYGMSYTELTANLPKLNATELKQIAQAPLMVWVNESHDLAKQIYSSLLENKKLGYRYSYHHFKTVRMQLLKGGVRLAALLDDIFK